MKNLYWIYLALLAISLGVLFGRGSEATKPRRPLPLPHNDSYPRRCAVDAQSHIQIRVISYGGKLFGICGSCGDWIPLRLDFGTNAPQATLETVPSIEIQYER